MLCPSRSDSTNIQQFNYVHHQSAVMLWKTPFWVGSTASLTITFLSCLILFVAHRTLALVWTYWINAISSLADSRDSLALINICKHKKRPRSDYLTRYISYFSNFLLHFIKLYLHFKLCWVLGVFFPSSILVTHKPPCVSAHFHTKLSNRTFLLVVSLSSCTMKLPSRCFSNLLDMFVPAVWCPQVTSGKNLELFFRWMIKAPTRHWNSTWVCGLQGFLSFYSPWCSCYR